MRPLETKAQKEARNSRDKTLIGLFIIIIMILSAVGYVMWGRSSSDEQSNPDIKTYNNYTFSKIDQGWMTETNISGQEIQIVTAYSPDELENITLESKPFLSDFMGKKLYIIANSIDERQAASEFAYSLANLAEGKIQQACSPEEENETFCLEKNLPIKSCDDADGNTAVIFLDENATGTGFRENCLAVGGQGTDLIKASDKSILTIFGIIK
jgi:hypothetical protein